MKPITVADVCKAVGGELAWGDRDAQVTGVHTDSRDITEGDLFVPIIGARVDAHDFIPNVIEQGAACVFSSKKDIEKNEKSACIFVEDTLRALQDLAAWYRSLFHLPVIGVTGSVGKTSTKEMIGAVLEKKYKTLITFKNMNSQVGLPLMMFNLDDSYEMAVFEMGISMPGEMDRLVDIAAPQSAAMTNIGVSHIGNLGSRENICAEKGRIIREFSDSSKLYACGNGDLYELISKNIPYDCCKSSFGTFFYGIKSEFEGDVSSLTYYAYDVSVDENGEEFTFHYPDGSARVRLSVMGDHNICNAVVAMAIGLDYGVDIADAIAAVGEYKPIDMRGVITEVKGVHVIDDTYNASPDSIKSNLKALFSHPGNGRRIAVLGDVLELGEQSEELHKSIGIFIEKEAGEGRRLDALYTVGKESETIVKYVTDNTDIPAFSCKDNKELTDKCKAELRDGDWVLFKGSRGMQLDQVVKGFAE